MTTIRITHSISLDPAELPDVSELMWSHRQGNALQWKDLVTGTDLGVTDYRYRYPGCPEYWDGKHCRCWYDDEGDCCWCGYDGVDELGAPDVVDLTP